MQIPFKIIRPIASGPVLFFFIQHLKCLDVQWILRMHIVQFKTMF